MKIDFNKSKELKKEFYDRPALLRLSLVLYDGQWYTKDKLKKVAKATEEEVEQFLKEDQNIIHKNNSYRVPMSTIFSFYEKNSLDLHRAYVPNNFSVKYVGKSSETEVFLDHPKRFYAKLLVYPDNETDLAKIKEVLKGKAAIRPNFGNASIRVFSTSNQYVLDSLKEEIPQIFARTGFHKIDKAKWRDITDFDADFITNLFDWYYLFVFRLVAPHWRTVQMFLSDQRDREAIVQEWILRACENFDETQTVPFSSYLFSSVQHWVYELPETTIGLQTAKFQRQRAKAIKKLQKDGKPFTEKEIKEILGYSKEEYASLYQRHKRWQQFKAASSYESSPGLSIRVEDQCLPGSLRPSLKKKHIVLPWQFYLPTKKRKIKTVLRR